MLAGLMLVAGACGGGSELPDGLDGTWVPVSSETGGFDGWKIDDGWWECIELDGSPALFRGEIPLGGYVKVTGISLDRTSGTLEPDLDRTASSGREPTLPCFSGPKPVKLDGDQMTFTTRDGTLEVVYERL